MGDPELVAKVVVWRHRQGVAFLWVKFCISSFRFSASVIFWPPVVVINGVINALIWVTVIVTLRITPLITTHEPSSTLEPILVSPSLARELGDPLRLKSLCHILPECPNQILHLWSYTVVLKTMNPKPRTNNQSKHPGP